MKVGIFQYKIKWENKKANKQRILELIENSNEIKDINWLIFPEMSLSGFSNNIRQTTLNTEEHQFFLNLSKRYQIYISYGAVERRYNKIITLNKNGERISEYSKINLFIFSKEDKYYKRGKKNVIFKMDEFIVSPFICFDLRFPVNFWKVFADIYVVIAAWPDKRIDVWLSLLKARAIENQAYVVGVNSIGEDKEKNVYSGYSSAFSPTGEMIVDCQSKEGISIFEIKKEEIDNLRKKFPIKQKI